MKNRILVLLIVLALAVVSGVGLTSAQQGTVLKAVTDGAATLYAEPSESAEVVAELADATVVTVLGTDETGVWLQVEAAEGAGYVMADNMIILDLPLLAPKAYVSTNRAGATSLFATPHIDGEYLMALPDGTVAQVLGINGEFAYIETPLGTGWSIATDWEFMPEGAAAVLANLRNQPELPVFGEMDINGEVIATIPDDSMVYQLGPAEGIFAQVLTGDGTVGYVVESSLAALPNLYVEADTGSNGTAALFAAPDMAADILGTVEDGTVFVYVEAVDDYWVEVFHPDYGMAYSLAVNMGNVYTVATIQVEDAVLRAGPNDNLYEAVSLLPAGTKVIVQGVNSTGAWVQVAIPFSEVDWSYNGVNGWLRDFLFVDGLGNSDVPVDMLGVTAE